GVEDVDVLAAALSCERTSWAAAEITLTCFPGRRRSECREAQAKATGKRRAPFSFTYVGSIGRQGFVGRGTKGLCFEAVHARFVVIADLLEAIGNRLIHHRIEAQKRIRRVVEKRLHV